jgi:hypothetical protein
MAARLIARLRQSPFFILAREFFVQFFVSESSTSDHGHRTAMIGVLAFLVTPGFQLPLQLSGVYEFAYLRMPALVEPMTRLIATIFLTYGMVAAGVIVAFVWDGLSFDRRDAMVLGPLPLSGATVVGAKLAAMTALLVATATSINVLTAAPFALVASSHKDFLAVGRHFVAHMAATTLAVAFVFGSLTTIRAAIGMLRRGRVIESVIQFLLVAAMLCFAVLTPSMLGVTRGRRGAATTIHMVPIPTGSPTAWFLGVYEVARGTNDGEFTRAAAIGLLATGLAIAAAISMTIAGYRRQLRAAVAPAATPSHQGGRLLRTLAHLLAGRDAVARGIADYVITTLSRSRAQQTPIAVIAAIGAALATIGLARSWTQANSFTAPSWVLLAVPLMLAYWSMVGLRAACFVPAELPSAWTFRVNGPLGSRAYRRGVVAAMAALAVPPAALLSMAALAATRDAGAIARSGLFTALLVVAFVEVLVSTIDFVPFTRPYRPGHAKLKSRWPLYFIGAYASSWGLGALELAAWHRPGGFAMLLAGTIAVSVALDLVGRRPRSRWRIAPELAPGDDDGNITLLELGPPIPHLNL